MKKKLILFFSVFLLGVSLPIGQNVFLNQSENVSAIGIYDEIRDYYSYQGDSVWVSAYKQGKLCSGYIYYSYKTWDWSRLGFIYTYYGTLRPGPYAPNSVINEVDK